MASRVGAILKQFREFWAGLPTVKRLALVGATVGVLVIVLAITAVGSRVDYTYLYSDLSAEDAAAIVQELESQKVPHRLAAGGSAIEVPRDQVHELRLKLASEGLPRGGTVGFELFDKSQMGATEFEQQVSLRRALEGELARSIMTLEGVQKARVLLVLPERRLFARSEERASASVVLKLRHASNFGKREVAGIVHLVSSAIPGLSRDRVSVVSTEGVTLHRPSTGGAQGELADMHVEQAATLASQLENHVREQLERVVGPGNADVRIAVDLDASARERTEEHFEPTKTALRSEHKVEESAGAEGAGVAGVPGALSNLPDGTPVPEATAPPEAQLAAAAPGEPGSGGTVRKSHTRNWEVERVTQKISTPPGDIERLSVAVLLNGSYREDGTFKARSKKELKGLEAIVKRAVGYNAARGDELTLRSAEFVKPEVDDASAAAVADPWWVRWLPYLIAGAGVLLLALAAIVMVWRGRRRRKKATDAGVVYGELTGAQDHDGPLLDGGHSPALEPAFSAMSEEETRAQALELAAKDPATAAVVLRKWLNAPTAGTPGGKALPNPA